MSEHLIGKRIHARLEGDGNDKGFTAKLIFWGDRIAVVEGDEQEFAFVHAMYEVKAVPSRIDIIGQNGNDGDHYNEE